MTIWERRDLPVLRALATSQDENVRQGVLSLERESPNPLGLELTTAEIHEAVLVLRDVNYIEGDFHGEGGRSLLVSHFQVTGRGQQALGEWPLFDDIASPETLALLLERLAEEAPTDEEADNLRRAAGYARSVTASSLRSFAISALVQLTKAHLGLGL